MSPPNKPRISERPCNLCAHASKHKDDPTSCAFCRGRSDRPKWEEVKIRIGDVEI